MMDRGGACVAFFGMMDAVVTSDRMAWADEIVPSILPAAILS